VPGNPGIPHYYCGFGEELQKSFEAEGLDSPTILGQIDTEDTETLTNHQNQSLLILYDSYQPSHESSLLFLRVSYINLICTVNLNLSIFVVSQRWEGQNPTDTIVKCLAARITSCGHSLSMSRSWWDVATFVSDSGSIALVMWILPLEQNGLPKDKKQVLCLWWRTAQLWQAMSPLFLLWGAGFQVPTASCLQHCFAHHPWTWTCLPAKTAPCTIDKRCCLHFERSLHE